MFKFKDSVIKYINTREREDMSWCEGEYKYNLAFNQNQCKGAVDPSYPIGVTENLSKQIAKYVGVNEKNIFALPSSDYFINHIYSIMKPGSKTVALKNTFFRYEEAAALHGVEYKEINSDIDVESLDKNTDLIIIVTPQQPSGKYIEPDVIESFINKISENTLIILDLAYLGFVDNKYDKDFKKFLKYKNVLLLNTFSKFEGLAGARVGWIASHEETLSTLLKTISIFNIPNDTVNKTIKVMNNQEWLNNVYEENKKYREIFQKQLKNNGIDFVESNINSIQIIDERIDYLKLFTSLKNDGILIGIKGNSAKITIPLNKEIMAEVIQRINYQINNK